MTDREMALLERVRQRRGDLVRLCSELVRINTVNPYSGDPRSAGEAAGQEFMASRFAGLGGAPVVEEPLDDVYERGGVLGPRDRSFEGRPNVQGRWPLGSGKGKRILLNGHMDTVAATDMTIDPFSGKCEDGFLWGRGSSDCKSGLTAGVLAVECLLEDPSGLDGEILFDSVVDEECNGSGAGTIACCLQERRPDVAVFLDGEAGHLTTGCNGCLTAAVTVWGESAHGASGLGVNAIDKAFLVKGLIDSFKADREAVRPKAMTNLGVLRAGVHPAVVPGSAVMELNIVYELEEARESSLAGHRWGGDLIMEEFAERMARAGSLDEWIEAHPVHVDWVKDLPPFATDETADIVTEGTKAFVDATGKEPAIGPISAWTDASFASILEDTPTILLGPSLAGAPHSPEERVKVDDLVECTQVLALLLHRILSE